MDIVDFIINVHPELPADERTRLASEIHEVDGVVSAGFSPGHPHMLEVAYNPEVVSSSAVLAMVGNQGIVADKVGL